MFKYFSVNNTRKHVVVLDLLVDQYIHAIHSSIKMTPMGASHNVRNSVAWLSQVFPRTVPDDILHWFPDSGWTRNFRLDYIKLP